MCSDGPHTFLRTIRSILFTNKIKGNPRGVLKGGYGTEGNVANLIVPQTAFTQYIAFHMRAFTKRTTISGLATAHVAAKLSASPAAAGWSATTTTINPGDINSAAFAPFSVTAVRAHTTVNVRKRCRDRPRLDGSFSPLSRLAPDTRSEVDGPHPVCPANARLFVAGAKAAPQPRVSPSSRSCRDVALSGCGS